MHTAVQQSWQIIVSLQGGKNNGATTALGTTVYSG
jgi:hypothetical protein